MNKNWTTKTRDLLIAQSIMEEYAQSKQVEALGLFELVFIQDEKQLSFRLANWVLALLERFNTLYGAEQADFVTRNVISCCMTGGQTVH